MVMPPNLHHVIALHAAGIADAVRLAQCVDHDGDSQYAALQNHLGGAIGIMNGIVAAAHAMEAVRLQIGEHVDWGDELPHVYLAWGAVAQGLWADMDRLAPEEITELALLRLIVYGEDEG